jgi:hypothetical protein
MSALSARGRTWRLSLFSPLLLIPGAVLAHGISEADKIRMLEGGFLQYVGLGASHMLTGYDHLLFLFGVVFFLTTFKDITRFITVFTLGHCLTLILATFFHISINAWAIDAVIALSVIYKGFDNNGGFQKYLDMKSPSLLWMVFLFGLIHGFGLSTRLQQLPLGDDPLAMLGRILSFNVGVEVGQIAALSVMVALLSFWRRRPSFVRFSTLANVGIMAMGTLLLFMQLHGYFHHTQAEEFRFPEKEHGHVHEDMAIEQLEKESTHDNL